jgi:ribosomal protein L1
MSTEVVFGLGGYDPSKPNNNIIEIIEIPDEVEPQPED